jgi:hypothetical protein
MRRTERDRKQLPKWPRASLHQTRTPKTFSPPIFCRTEPPNNNPAAPLSVEMFRCNRPGYAINFDTVFEAAATGLTAPRNCLLTDFRRIPSPNNLVLVRNRSVKINHINVSHGGSQIRLSRYSVDKVGSAVAYQVKRFRCPSHSLENHKANCNSKANNCGSRRFEAKESWHLPLIPACGDIDSLAPSSEPEPGANIPLDHCTFLQWMSRWGARRHESGSASFGITQISLSLQRYPRPYHFRGFPPYAPIRSLSALATRSPVLLVQSINLYQVSLAGS